MVSRIGPKTLLAPLLAPVSPCTPCSPTFPWFLDLGAAFSSGSPSIPSVLGDLVIPGSLHLLKKEQALNTILLFKNITINFYADNKHRNIVHFTKFMP